MKKKSLILVCAVLMQLIVVDVAAQKIADFNLVHKQKGTDSWSSMPLGNGELSAQVWTNPNGAIELYLGRTDSRDAMDNVLKIGKLSLQFEPNILLPENGYTETLVVDEGLFRIKNSTAQIEVRVDANNQALVIAGYSSVPVKIKVTNNIWRKENRNWQKEEYIAEYGNNEIPFEPYMEADETIKNLRQSIGWYHRNTSDVFFTETMRANDMLNEGIKSPLINRTFGAIVSGNGLLAVNDTVLQSAKEQKQFIIKAVVDCKQTPSAEAFVQGLQKLSGTVSQSNEPVMLAAHKKWWADFWTRSYVFFTADEVRLKDTLHILNRGYVLQRYVNAIGGRGNLPIKFNGSTLVLDTYKNKIGNVSGKSADARLWSGAFWWQNTRLMYFPMLTSGDFDLIEPFIKFYKEQLRVAKIMTKKFYGHDGARLVETTHFWGVWRGGDIGWNRAGLQPGISTNPYIKDVIIAGLEIVNYLLDYHAYTKDEALMQNTILPFATDILLFYDQHYKRDASGKLLIAPAQSLETFIEGVNPTPDIAGLQFVVPRVKRFAKNDLLQLCERLESAIPEIPTGEVNGKKVILPIASFKKKINVEFPELYPVFPFRLYGTGKSNNPIASETFKEKQRSYQGWHQTAIQAAMLGITDSASKILISNGLAFDKRFRFPAFWGPNYDYTPDQCHAGNFINTIQTMILQAEDDNIYLLPAWPGHWNLKFKLHAPGKTAVEGEWKNGKMIQYKTSPAQRVSNVSIGFK